MNPDAIKEQDDGFSSYTKDIVNLFKDKLIELNIEKDNIGLMFSDEGIKKYRDYPVAVIMVGDTDLVNSFTNYEFLDTATQKASKGKVVVDAVTDIFIAIIDKTYDTIFSLRDRFIELFKDEQVPAYDESQIIIEFKGARFISLETELPDLKGVSFYFQIKHSIFYKREVKVVTSPKLDIQCIYA